MLLSIFGAKAWDAPPQHGSMPPPIEGGAEQRRQGVGHPLTVASHHHLYLAGHGLDQYCFPMGFSPVKLIIWVSPLFLCASQHRKAPFGELFHVFVLMTCKIMFSKYMWNLVNSKCMCLSLLIFPIFVS